MYLSTTTKYIDPVILLLQYLHFRFISFASRISGVSKCFNTSGAFGFLPVGTGSAILLRYCMSEFTESALETVFSVLMYGTDQLDFI